MAFIEATPDGRLTAHVRDVASASKRRSSVLVGERGRKGLRSHRDCPSVHSLPQARIIKVGNYQSWSYGRTWVMADWERRRVEAGEGLASSRRSRYAMTNSRTVVSFRQPDTAGDPLTAVLKIGARGLFAPAI
jgi:hypothetical protein